MALGIFTSSTFNECKQPFKSALSFITYTTISHYTKQSRPQGWKQITSFRNKKTMHYFGSMTNTYPMRKRNYTIQSTPSDKPNDTLSKPNAYFHFTTQSMLCYLLYSSPVINAPALNIRILVIPMLHGPLL
jgi:hypothetical protein